MLDYKPHPGWPSRLHVQASVSKDYLGGLAITPDGLYTLAAAADGMLSLLDMRKAGARLSYASCSAPLLCLQTDGRYAAVGLENGQVIRLTPSSCRAPPPVLFNVSVLFAADPYRPNSN